MIRNKTIKFNLDKQEDRELWEWLQSQPHGFFSEMTKQFWRIRMEQSSRNKHDEKISKLRTIGDKYKDKMKEEI